jgi:hypothetical protein
LSIANDELLAFALLARGQDENGARVDGTSQAEVEPPWVGGGEGEIKRARRESLMLVSVTESFHTGRRRGGCKQ